MSKIIYFSADVVKNIFDNMVACVDEITQEWELLDRGDEWNEEQSVVVVQLNVVMWNVGCGWYCQDIVENVYDGRNVMSEVGIDVDEESSRN